MPGSIVSVAFAGDNDRLLVSRVDGLVELREARTGNLLEVLAQAADEGWAMGAQRAAVSPDGRLILVASQPGVIRVLERDSLGDKEIPISKVPSPTPGDSSIPPAAARALSSIRTTFGGESVSAPFSVSVDHVATVSQGRLQLWQTQSATASQAWHEQAAFGLFGFSADGKLLAAASEDRRITIWNTATGTAVAVVSGSISGIQSLVFSMDGERLAALGTDGTVQIWDVKSGRELRSITASVQLMALDREGSRLQSLQTHNATLFG